MPIYEYICQDCKKPFEKLVVRSGQSIECPACGSSNHALQFSVFRSAKGQGSSNRASTSDGGCACTPSTCGCH